MKDYEKVALTFVRVNDEAVQASWRRTLAKQDAIEAQWPPKLERFDRLVKVDGRHFLMKDYEIDAAKLQVLDKLVDAVRDIFDGTSCPFCKSTLRDIEVHKPGCYGAALESACDEAVRLQQLDA